MKNLATKPEKGGKPAKERRWRTKKKREKRLSLTSWRYKALEC